MMSSFLALCAVLNVQVVQAPFEADSQLAYMSRIGVISTILTEDSDLILYGCSSILFKYDVINGTVDHFCSNSLHKTIFGKSNISILLEICLLSGCDYLRHLPGIGIVTARKMRLKFNSISETLLHLLSQKKIDMFYIRDFIKAFMSFVYQPIVDLRSGSINLLKNYNSDDVADYFQLKSNPIMASISVDLLINCPAFLMENYTPIDLPNLSREAIQSIISLDRRMAKKFKQSKMDLLCPPEKRVRKEILDPELLYKINSELEALQDDEDEELELDIDEMDLDENELFDLLHFNESIELGNDNKNKNIRITRYCTINTLLTDNAVKTIRKVVDLMPMITHEASNLLYDFLIDHPRIFPLISDPDVWYFFFNLFYKGKIPKFENSKGQKLLAQRLFGQNEVEQTEQTKQSWQLHIQNWLRGKDYTWLHSKNNFSNLSLSYVLASRARQLAGNFLSSLPNLINSWIKNFVHAHCRMFEIPTEITKKLIFNLFNLSGEDRGYFDKFLIELEFSEDDIESMDLEEKSTVLKRFH
ncbi:hypothetical protein RCL1_002589 [Eukaryota sp. TZLM3-RCL]